MKQMKIVGGCIWTDIVECVAFFEFTKGNRWNISDEDHLGAEEFQRKQMEREKWATSIEIIIYNIAKQNKTKIYTNCNDIQKEFLAFSSFLFFSS